MHHYGVTDFAQMTDVAKELRAALSDAYDLSRPEVVERQVSVDGTRKWLIRMAPGVEVETVYIPDVGRSGALCVSSQVGCTLNCTFCHTGTQPLVRNLTAAEIVAQVQVARDELGEWPSPKEDRRLSNIVFMGMGEPLYNLDGVADAIDIIADNEGIAISRRRITVSTSGVVPELKALGERTQAMLAISLHATNDALRDELAASQPQLTPWFERQIPAMYSKAYRWVAEMQEISQFVAADEAASELFAAVAKFYERMAADHAGAKAETGALADFLARKPGS
jgi:23S rRNA (adenine2503-C2)-methyltransferase